MLVRLTIYAVLFAYISGPGFYGI
uniref:Uncharacterized protein n=1 Tax=Rhizophora mucronata TaxID=61149 RepID=A0A2P2QW73_RHIMU